LLPRLLPLLLPLLELFPKLEDIFLLLLFVLNELFVKEFVEKKDLNISIIGCDTVRERSGLALSSRNNLLSSEEKLLAPLINKTLEQLKNKKNKLNKSLLIKKAKYLSSKGFIVDYIEACDTESLEETFEIDKKDILIAIAAKLGNVRLIDNILLQKL
jgi:pantoate--beta-alanine ligase